MSVTPASPDFIVAIDFGGTKLDVATATLDGRVLATERLRTAAADGAEQAVERALACARALRDATTATTGGRLAAVGATSPGIVLDDRILLAPNVPGWTGSRSPRGCARASASTPSSAPPTSRPPRWPRPAGARCATPTPASSSTSAPASPRAS